MELKKFSNKEQMSLASSRYTKELIYNNTELGNVFTIALSGGSSPVRFYELLAEEDIDWAMVKIFLVDERKVPANHQHSNFRMVKEALLSKIDIPDINIFSLKTEIESVSDCADEYKWRIVESFDKVKPVFDLIILGIGLDGHTASLFPGNNQALESGGLFIPTIAPSQFDVPERLTMTLSLINGADKRLFIVSGKGKGEIIQRVLDHDSAIPSGMINTESLIFTDSMII